MSSKTTGVIKRPPKRILPKESPPDNNVIYFMSQIDDQITLKENEIGIDHGMIPKDEIEEGDNGEQIFHIIEQSSVDVDIVDEDSEREYTETITIISEDKNLVEEHVVYVNEDGEEEVGDEVTFMQVS